MKKSSPPSPETTVNSGPVTLIMSKKYRKAFYVLACIVLGNISYYMLRAHFQITKPEMERQGILNDESYGSILIGSYFVNIIGKPLGGFFADYWKRPKLSFVVCIFLTVACTLIVTLVPQYDPIAVLWCLGRLFTTMGRMNVIKIVSSIFPSTVMGTVMGIITVSCSVGEAVAKVTLSQLLNFLSWQHMFYVASGLTLLLMSPTIFYVKDSKIREACRNKENEKENAALNATLSSVEIIPPAPIHDEKKLYVKFSTPSMLASPIAALKPHQLFLAKMRTLFIMPRFLLILVMACTITIIREAIGAWAIPFLTKMLGYPSSSSGTIHGLFSLVSAASSLIAGRAIDSIPRRHRGLFFAAYMFGVSIFQLSLTLFISQNNITSTGVFPDNIVVTTSSMATSTIQAVVVAFLFLSEFCLGPPVSFIDGVFIIDLVEPNLVSFASGLVGSFGYLGAICVTHPLRVWAGNLEYTSLWALSSGCGFACAVLSVLYYWLDKRMQAAAAGRKSRISNI